MEQFVRDRITKLRLLKGVSEYQMSYDLGHSRGYINNITSGKSMPSMNEFFSICAYFDISPSDFFNIQHDDPALLSTAIKEIRHLSDNDILIILSIIQRFNKDKG